MDIELLVCIAFEEFYQYLGSLPDGEALQEDMVMVNAAAGRRERSCQASEAACRLADVAERTPLLSETLVAMFNDLAEELRPC